MCCLPTRLNGEIGPTNGNYSLGLIGVLLVISSTLSASGCHRNRIDFGFCHAGTRSRSNWWLVADRLTVYGSSKPTYPRTRSTCHAWPSRGTLAGTVATNRWSLLNGSETLHAVNVVDTVRQLLQQSWRRRQNSPTLSRKWLVIWYNVNVYAINMLLYVFMRRGWIIC